MAHWYYLNTTPFKSRMILAAGYLTDCPTIIELGGYMSPISDFLKHPYEKVLSVDPLTDPKKESKILHLAKDYREVDFTPYTKKDYGIVMLGMDLPFSQKLFELITRAKKVIIEFPPDHLPSVNLFEEILLISNLQQDLCVHIDLTDNYFQKQDSYPVFPKRSLYVFSNTFH